MCPFFLHCTLNICTDLVVDFIQGHRPRLAIVQVGDRSDSNVYINMKRKAGDEIGIAVDHVRIPRSVAEVELLERIDALNSDLGVDGIIVQMPLDCDAK